MNELIPNNPENKTMKRATIPNKPKKNSPPYKEGDDCNPRQPDYNRGRLTRAVQEPSFRETASYLAVTREKARKWQQNTTNLKTKA